MDPKVMVMMGMGGLMFFMFIIIGIVVWINSEDDEGTESGTGGDNSGGDNSGGDNSGGDNSGGDNSGGDNSGGDNSGGDNSGGDNSGGDNSGDCPSGQVRFEEDGKCYPKCRGGFAWSMAAVGGSAWPGGGCGISDASLAWSKGGASLRAAEAENCRSRFSKADASATGYIQCIAPGEDGGVSGFCLNHKQGRPEAIIECVPENHSNGVDSTPGVSLGEVGFESDPSKANSSKKIPKCAVPGLGGVHGAWNSGGYSRHVGDKWTNVKDEDGDYHGGSCVCPDGYTFKWHDSTGIGSGTGGDGANNLWSCQ